MGQKTCANHEKAPAVSSCHQCHKDLCKSCVMVTPTGTFCSSECSVLFREMKSMGDKDKKKGGGVGMKLVFVLLLAVAALFGIHLTNKGASYDIIGKILNSTKAAP